MIKMKTQDREKLYRDVMQKLAPLQKEFGIQTLRWALNKWTQHESKIASLNKKKRDIEAQLAVLSK